MTHAEYATGLRELAAFIEAHEDIPVPLSINCATFAHLPKDEQKSHAAHVAKELGYVYKETYGTNLQLVHKFNELITYQVWYDRDALCERVVTGMRDVPEQFLPAREETLVPAHTEEIVEWHCAPILAPSAITDVTQV